MIAPSGHDRSWKACAEEEASGLQHAKQSVLSSISTFHLTPSQSSLLEACCWYVSWMLPRCLHPASSPLLLSLSKSVILIWDPEMF